MNKVYVLLREEFMVNIPCLVPRERVAEVVKGLGSSRLGAKFEHWGPAGVSDRRQVDNLIVRFGHNRDEFDRVKRETKRVYEPKAGGLFTCENKEVPVAHEDPRNDFDALYFLVPLSKVEFFMARLKRIRGVELVFSQKEKPVRRKKPATRQLAVAS